MDTMPLDIDFLDADAGFADGGPPTSSQGI